MILLTIFFVFVPYIIMKISLVCEALKKKPKIIVMKIKTVHLEYIHKKSRPVDF